MCMGHVVLDELDGVPLARGHHSRAIGVNLGEMAPHAFGAYGYGQGAYGHQMRV